MLLGADEHATESANCVSLLGALNSSQNVYTRQVSQQPDMLVWALPTNRRLVYVG